VHGKELAGSRPHPEYSLDLLGVGGVLLEALAPRVTHAKCGADGVVDRFPSQVGRLCDQRKTVCDRSSTEKKPEGPELEGISKRIRQVMSNRALD
jgi:hypothetical protein